MDQHKFAFDLRPGDVLADDDDHNGDPHIMRVVHDRQMGGDTLSIYFADGSICEPEDLARVYRLA